MMKDRTTSTFNFAQCLRLTLLAMVLTSPVTAFAPGIVSSKVTRQSKTQVSLFWAQDEKTDRLLPSVLPTTNRSNNNNQSSSYSSSVHLPTAATFLVGTPAAGALLWETFSTLPTPSPFVVSEILTDASHVALDLITFLGPSAAVVRLFAVIGRILCVLADYVPDKAMNPEEVVFQAFMLTVACAGLLQVWLPGVMAKALAPAPTLRDGKAYKAWGAPAGMTWEQYKALTVSALQWKELAPGESLTLPARNEKNHTTLYWLYKGEIQVDRDSSQSFRKKSSTVMRRQPEERLRQIEGAQHVDLTTFKPAHHDGTTATTTTITAGSQGATLLTCQMHRVMPLLQHDGGNLREVFKVLLWQGLQDQLAHAYQYHHSEGESS